MTKASLLRAEEGLPRGVQGAADSRFSNVVRVFAGLFPGRRFGGGALSVYIDGHPVVDVWTGWSDRAGEEPWTVDTGAMVFSATKGIAATVVHRLVDRGLLSYDEPVATYWPEFGANGKGTITVRDVLRHRAGLSHLKGVSRNDLLDHEMMEERLAAASVDHLRGWPAYHALTYGWILSGLTRAVTGHGHARADPRRGGPSARHRRTAPGPPAGRRSDQGRADPCAAEHARATRCSTSSRRGWPACRCPVRSARCSSPASNHLCRAIFHSSMARFPPPTASSPPAALRRCTPPSPTADSIDDTQFLSNELAQGLIGKPKPWPDLNIVVPMPFHLGYHESPIPGLLKGFGHIGLGGTLGWADPQSGSAFAFVHNRLLTPMVLDMASFAGLARPMRNAITAARHAGAIAVPRYGARYREAGQQAPKKRVAGRR